MNSENQFSGWAAPTENWSKLPHEFWQIIDLTVHEKLVLLYLLRHTWGYQEYGIYKRITLDEFQNGRKSQNGDRIDAGLQMARGTVSQSLRSLCDKGYIAVIVDDSDKARIKKSYCLKMYGNSVQSDDSQSSSGDSQSSSGDSQSSSGDSQSSSGDSQSSSGDNRTEKETKKETKKEKLYAPDGAEGDTAVSDDTSNEAQFDDDVSSTEEPASTAPEASDEKPPVLSTEQRQEYLSVLRDVYHQYAATNRHLHLLRGTLKPKRPSDETAAALDYFRAEPVTLRELRHFPIWYRQVTGDDVALPSKYEALHNWFIRYRQANEDKRKKSTPISRRPVPVNVAAMREQEAQRQ